MKLYVRDRLTVQLLAFAAGHQIQFEIDKPCKATVAVRAPTNAEIETGFSERDCFCEAIGQFEASEPVRDELRRVAANVGWSPLSECSAPTRDFVTSVASALGHMMREVATAVRWRLGERGPAQPFSVHAAEWSEDRSHWFQVPSDMTVELLRVQRNLRPTEGEVEDIGAILRAGTNEPVAHSLFREAEVQYPENRRAAIALAIMAVEVGAKSLIADLTPETEWILRDLPAPPVTKLLSGLENLKGVKKPPKSVMKTMQAGMETRNKVVHRGETASTLDVRELLQVVDSLLWGFDHFRGHAWATEHMRQDILEQWGIQGDESD